MKKYKAAVVGCGRIGCEFDDDIHKRNFSYTHAGAYERSNNTELAALCDIDKERVMKYAVKYNTFPYTDYKVMLEQVEPDIVIICTPMKMSKVNMVKDCINAGVKAIYCEKPLSMRFDEALEINNICAESDVLLAVNYQRRFSMYYRELARYIQSGKIGTIEHVIARYTGGLYNTGSHIIDLVTLLCGSGWSKLISAKKLSSGTDPNVHALYTLQNGTYVTIIPISGQPMFETEVIGTLGRLIIKNYPYVKEGIIDRVDFVTDNHNFEGAKQQITREFKYGSPQDKDFLVNAVNEITEYLDGNKSNLLLWSSYDAFRGVELMNQMENYE